MDTEHTDQREARRRALIAHYDAENDDVTGDGKPQEANRFAVVTAPAENQDGSRTLTTWQAFEDAAAHLGDQILDGFTPLDGIFDLDTGEMIELHVSTPIVSRSEDQGAMQNPLDAMRTPGERIAAELLAWLNQPDEETAVNGLTVKRTAEFIDRLLPTRRLGVTIEQLRGLGECAADPNVDGSPECVVLPYDELTRIGLDLPDGTVEVRIGDGFCAIAPDGKCIEST